MKFLKISAIVFALGFVFQLSAYISRTMSYKYEVELMRTVVKQEKSEKVKADDLKKIAVKEKALILEKRINLILIFVCLFALLINLYFLYRKHKSGSSHSSV